jgi:hypothetical protein
VTEEVNDIALIGVPGIAGHEWADAAVWPDVATLILRDRRCNDPASWIAGSTVVLNPQLELDFPVDQPLRQRVNGMSDFAVRMVQDLTVDNANRTLSFDVFENARQRLELLYRL